MYHPSTPWYSHDPRCLPFLWMRAFVPGGASGVLLKSKIPNKYVYADNFGLVRDDLNRLSVSIACGSNLSHSAIGKSGSHVANPARRWFFSVLIALSAAFLLCMLGGVSSNVLLFFFNAARRSLLHSLSKTKCFVLCPHFVSDSCSFSHASVIVFACLFFNGSAKIALES